MAYRSVVLSSFLLFLSLSLVPLSVSAQEDEPIYQMSIEGLMAVKVVTVSKKEEDLRTAPSNVSVITEKQIKEWGARDIKDILRRAAGIQIIPDRDEWVFAVRGNVSDNNLKYLVLLDGHRLNSNENFGPGQIIELPNDLSNVKRIEIIRGPGSAVWGPDALAGVINIITKNAGDLGADKHHIKLGIGLDDLYRASFQFGENVTDDVDFILHGSFGMQHGTKVTQSAATTLPILERESGFDSHPFGTYTTALERHDPGYMLQFKGRAGKFKINSMVFSTETFNRHFEVDQGRENYLTTDKWFVEGIYSREFDEGWEFTWKASTDLNRAEYLPKKGTAFNIRWEDRKISTSVDLSKTFSECFSLDFGWEGSYTELGPNHRLNALNLEDHRAVQEGFLFDDYLEDRSTGGYLMLNYSLTEDLNVHAGSRYDFNNDRGTDRHALNPRLAVVWKAGSSTVLKALYNRGFLRPAHYQAVSGSVESETIDQVDLVWLQNIKGGSLMATLFWQKLEGFINIISIAETSSFANTGDYEAQGLELEFNYPVSQALDLWANYSFSDAEGKNFPEELALNARRVKPDGTLLSYAPHTAKLGGTWHIKDDLFVSPALRFASETDYRVTPPIDSLADASYDTTPNLTYFDLNIGYEPKRNLGVYFYIDNLLDEDEPNHLTVWNGTVGAYGRYYELILRTRF